MHTSELYDLNRGINHLKIEMTILDKVNNHLQLAIKPLRLVGYTYNTDPSVTRYGIAVEIGHRSIERISDVPLERLNRSTSIF